MKKYLLLVCFSSIAVFGQQKKFSLDWVASEKIITENSAIEVPFFNKEFCAFDFSLGLQFIAQWEVSAAVNETSVSISQVNYSNISLAELKALDIDKIPNKLSYSLKNSVARDKRFAMLQLSPIIKENGVFKKIISFQVDYNTGTSRTSIAQNKTSKSKVISNSVLSSGEWFRFSVDTTGVFKLNKSFLRRLGVNVNNIDPRTIRLYGNGGRMIPYANSEDYPFDVPENAIKFVGEEDGVFNDSDYILFYAQGPKEYNIESNTNINCYNDKTYYYINTGSGNGKRITPFAQPSGPIDLEIDTFEEYKFHELDKQNIALLGRRWFGERFDVEEEQTFKFNFPNLITDTPITLRVYVAAISSIATSMGVSVNGNKLATLEISEFSKTILANEAFFYNNVAVTDSEINVQLNYDNKGDLSALGYLDYISIEAKRALEFVNSQFQFKNSEVETRSGIGQYTISNASKVSEVWDVTDIYNVTNFENTSAESNLTFTSNLGVLKTYVALTPSDYFEPQYDGTTKISNQNIKGTIFLNSENTFQDIDYIIVSPDNMLSQAERLAQINEQQYGLNVKVLGLNEIYTEFSTGNQDIGAIRNLVKYVYDNASSPEGRIKYLCLLGDGSFDYKDRIPNNTNIVPSWYSYNSLSLSNSFVSDDFYGMMDDNEGAMDTSDKLDIAVGRILADTPEQATKLIDKIESYYIKEAVGSWRNNVVVISDDVDEDWEGSLQETTDLVGNLITNDKPFLNVTKIHSDAYKQESSVGGNTYPQATTEIIDAINNGALVVNYFGHGGENGIASERLLSQADVKEFRNYGKLNCFITVTCEYTKFDNPYKVTAGELTYWNEKAGAIALISTTRQIYVSFAIDFNRNFGQYLFSYATDDDYEHYEYPTMAEALRLTKNNPIISNSNQRRLVFFIGDPAMKLAFAKPNIELTKVNDVPLAQVTDTIKALGYVKLAGEVTDVSGNLLSDYNGIVSTTIYDKDIKRKTLANDRTTLDGKLVTLDFTTLGRVIFRGQASVKNGAFEFDFIVPKDIGIPVGYGKISFYSKEETLGDNQAGASIASVKIGGLNEDAPEDNTGPVITLYMNDENFVSGGITNESPTLLAKMEDENGVNTASGIGHDIVAIIDGDETNPVVLNDYYQTEVDDYKKGTLSYAFRDLEPGLHTLSLKVWDVYNNSSVSEIQFIVYDKDQALVIDNVLNYPNPFVNYTEFWFNHNSSDVLDVSVQIFTVSGKLVRTLNGQTAAGFSVTSSLSRDIVWDGRDDFGDKIGKGVYIYKLSVHSSLLNKTVEKIEKLVIL